MLRLNPREEECLSMATIKTDLDGSATILLSSGKSIRVSPFKNPPGVDAQDVRNVMTALIEAVTDLDNRVAALEGRGK
jgi:hypothetical protein